MTIETARAEIAVRARVTERMRPLKIDGPLLHQVALPWHWGFGGPTPATAANDLVMLSGDPNTRSTSPRPSSATSAPAARRRDTGTLAGIRADTPRRASTTNSHPAEVPRA